MQEKTLFVLFLNDMRSAHIEDLRVVAWAEDREKLEAFIETETVKSYQDGRWRKTFRQGGPLEWFNRPEPPNPHSWPPNPGSIREAPGIVLDGNVWVSCELTRDNNVDFTEMV